MDNEKLETLSIKTVYKLKKIQRAVSEKSAYEIYALSLLFEFRALKEFSETYLKVGNYIPLKEIAKECVEQYEFVETQTKKLLCLSEKIKDMPSKTYLKKRERILKKQNEFLNSVCADEMDDESYYLIVKALSKYIEKLCLITDKYCSKPNVFAYTDKLQALILSRKENLKYLSNVTK